MRAVKKIGQHTSRKRRVIEKGFLHVAEGCRPRKFCERMWDNLLREGFEVALHETDVGLQQGDCKADLRADGCVEPGFSLVFALMSIKENRCGERDERGENSCEDGLF